MIHLAVQQLEANRHPVVLSDFFYAVQPGNRVFCPFFVGHARAIPGKCDHVRHTLLRRYRNIFPEGLLDLRVIFHPVQSVGNIPAAGIPHAANQPVAAWHLPLFHTQQVNRLQPHLRAPLAQLVQRNFLVTPARNGLLDSPLARRCMNLLRPRGRRGR